MNNAVFSDEQKAIIEAPLDERTIVMATAASGKAQPDDTIIPTPYGPKRIGDIQVGDFVWSRTGEPIEVIGVFPQGEKEVWEVTLADGRKTLCCDEHLWSYDNKKGKEGKYTTNTLKRIVELGWVRIDNRGHHEFTKRIPNCLTPLEYPESDLMVDPYIMGAFLGDGCTTDSERNLTLSSENDYIPNLIAEAIEGEAKKRSLANYSWDFYKDGKHIRTKEFFQGYVDEICTYCHEKRIPLAYKIGSIEQRKSLLQGLMDTDGSIGKDTKGAVTYTSTSKGLIDDVREVCWSLGILSTLKIDEREGRRICYSIALQLPNDQYPTLFRLPRKVAIAEKLSSHKKRTNHKFVSIVDIQSLGYSTPMTCIKVDHPEELYLTNDFIVTHNTRCSTERLVYVLEHGINPKKVVALTFTNNAASEMNQRVPEEYRKEGYPFIGTLHGYANMLLSSHGFDTSAYRDEDRFDELFDMIYENPNVLSDIDYLIVDEVQDMNAYQLDFLGYLDAKACLYVGDVRQSIYGFKDAKPQHLLYLMKQPEYVVRELTQNYRNGKNILLHSNKIIKKMKGIALTEIEPMRNSRGKVEFLRNTDLIALLKRENNYANWAILCRTNQNVRQVMNTLMLNNIPTITFRQAQNELGILKAKIEKNAVKVLTIHSAKGLEFDKVAVYNGYNRGEEALRIDYVAVTRARDELYLMTQEPPGAKKYY